MSAYAFAALAGLQLINGYQQGEIIRANAKIKQRIDDMNAERADIDAHNAWVDGFSQSARYQSVIDQTVAAQRAGFASENVDVNYGTAAEIQNETRHTGLLNQLEIERQARERALGYKNEARNLRIGAGFSRMQAENMANAQVFQGLMQAGSTGLTGYRAGKENSGGDASWFFGTSPRPHAQPMEE